MVRAKWWTCEEVQRWESRAFGAYLSLPVEEYALLDPSIIERIDADSFRLAVPLGDIFADLGFGSGERGTFRLVPQMVIRVEIDAESRQVTFVGDEAGLGYAPLDERFDLQVCSQAPLVSQAHVPIRPAMNITVFVLLHRPFTSARKRAHVAGGGKVQTRARKRSNVHIALLFLHALKSGTWAP